LEVEFFEQQEWVVQGRALLHQVLDS
jgi:hypothetical protein